MSDKRIAELIREISKMAERVGCVFIPDKKKIAAIRSPRPSQERNRT